MTESVKITPPSLDRSMRAKQLASTVRQGRKITIQILDEEPFTGYLAGWDEDTYFLIVPEEPGFGSSHLPVKKLIPKSNILWIELYEERSFFEHHQFELMNPTVQPFKDWINKNYFPSARS